MIESTNITYVNKLNPTLLRRLYGDNYKNLLNKTQEKILGINLENKNENIDKNIPFQIFNIEEEEKKQNIDINNDNNNSGKKILFFNKLNKNNTNLVLNWKPNINKNKFLQHSQICYNINYNLNKNKNNNSLDIFL